MAATAPVHCRPRACSRKVASAPKAFCGRRPSGSRSRFSRTSAGVCGHRCDRKTVGPVVDPETGLQYLINRYYDPATGQFLSVDPLVGLTQQPYQYVGDNPLNETDTLGLCSGWLGCITHYVAEGAEYTAIGATTVAIGATVVATDGADAPLAIEAEGGLLSTLSVTSAEDAATATSIANGASKVSTGFSGLQTAAQCIGIAAHEATAANCGADIGSTLLGFTGPGIGSAAGLSGPGNLLFANSLSLLGDGFSDGPWGYNQVGQSSSQPTPCEQQQTISSLQLLLGGGLP